MNLDVGLVDHIESVSVAKLVEYGELRVVACAHGVDVVLFHQADIAHYSGGVHDVAVGGVMFVQVDAVHFDGLSVDEELSVFDFHLAEADVGDGSFTVAERDNKAVEVGGLGAPGLHFSYGSASE